MDVTIKHRLVGAAVLLLLAVIFLPMVFDGANQKALLSDTRMPTPPPVPKADALLAEPAPQMPQAEQDIAKVHEPVEPETAVIPPVTAPAVPAQAPATAPAATPAATSAEPAAATPAVPDARPDLAEAWDVQVAALATPDAADKLRAKLASAGYKARVHAAPSAGKTVYRVLVGPELRRDAAQAMRERLAADARVGKPAGLLQRYVP